MNAKKLEITKGMHISFINNRDKSDVHAGDVADIYEDDEGLNITLDTGYDLFIQTK